MNTCQVARVSNRPYRNPAASAASTTAKVLTCRRLIGTASTTIDTQQTGTGKCVRLNTDRSASTAATGATVGVVGSTVAVAGQRATQLNRPASGNPDHTSTGSACGHHAVTTPTAKVCRQQPRVIEHAPGGTLTVPTTTAMTAPSTRIRCARLSSTRTHGATVATSVGGKA